LNFTLSLEDICSTFQWNTPFSIFR